MEEKTDKVTEVVVQEEGSCVDPSDDAGDGGGNSKGVSPASRTTDPNSHTPVGVKLAANHRTRHLQ